MRRGHEGQSALSKLECTRCALEHDADRVQQLCSCGGPLFARYDLAAARGSLTFDSLANRAHDLWRFRELLPVRNDDAIVSLGEQMTPIISLARTGEKIGLDNLFLKDEGLLPTGSFKARGAAVGVSRARELGVSAFAMPTNGNAGTAWAVYGARGGLSATIVMPAVAPAIHRTLCALAGATVFLVNGLIGDAGRLVSQAVSRNHLYDAATLKEPYRIEGKKTLGFEIAEQFDWHLPDVIIYPTGGGVGLIGMHKAFRELQELGLLEKRLPRFISVQASGCAPIVLAWQEGRDASTLWENANTLAFGINVPKALGDFLVLRILRESGGDALAVDDDAILECQNLLVAREGVLACPEGGATLAAAIALHKQGKIEADERVLLINTGGGALYPDVPIPKIEIIEPGGELPTSQGPRV
jgi:threonine synthase